MLRPPSTRVDLTPDDIDGFEARLAARRTRRRHNRDTFVRVNAGPGRQTSQTIPRVSQHTNGHGATPQVDSGDDEESGDASNRFENRIHRKAAPVDTIALASAALAGHRQMWYTHGLQGQAEDVRPALPRSSSETSDCGPLPSNNDVRRDLLHHEGTIGREQVISSPLSGDISTNSSSAVKTAALRELSSDAFPINPPLRSSPRPFSSARARRYEIFHDSTQQQELIESRHRDRIPPYQSSSLLPSPRQAVPHLVPDLLVDGIPSLDPSAPVFVPRTRFASSRHQYSNAVQWRSMDSTYSSTNLRIRPISEQNVDSRASGHSDTGDPLVRPQHRRHRPRSRTSGQHRGLAQPTPNIERYPLLHPNTRVSRELHGTSAAAAPIVESNDQILPGTPPSLATATTQFHVRHVNSTEDMYPLDRHLTCTNGVSGILSMINDIPPTASINSSSPQRFVPDTLCSDEQDHGVSTNIPEILPTVGIENGSGEVIYSDQSRDLSRMSSYRRNHSPLEQLTKDLGRLSASLERPQSVGRSVEARPRVSLLHGNPFSEQSLPPSPSISPRVLQSNSFECAKDIGLSSPEPPSASSLALDTSPPLPSSPGVITSALLSSPPLPGSSPLRTVETKSEASPSTIASADDPRHTSSQFARPSVPSTPRVRVYNDFAPPHTQPQTPAHLLYTQSRLRTHSAKVTRTGLHPDRTLSSPTHSSIQTSINIHLTSSSPPPTATIPSHPQATPVNAPRIPPRRRRARTQDIENELDGVQAHLPELRRERRAWLGRRGPNGEQGLHGELEVTPPAEGRFERILSRE